MPCSLFVNPLAWLCLPVRRQARDGPLREFATKLFVNRAPSSAIRSMWGVRIYRRSYALMVWYEWSSHMMYTTFSGFFGSASRWVQAPAAARAVAPVRANRRFEGMGNGSSAYKNKE